MKRRPRPLAGVQPGEGGSSFAAAAAPSAWASSAPLAMRSHQIRQGSILAGLPPTSNGIKNSTCCPHSRRRQGRGAVQLTAEGRQVALEGGPPGGDEGAVVGRGRLSVNPVLQTLEEGRGGEEAKPQAAALAANSRGLQAEQG